MSREFHAARACDPRRDPDPLIFWLLVILYLLFAPLVPGLGSAL